MFQTKVVEKIRTRILYSVNLFYPENLTVYEIMWEKYCTAVQATDDNIKRRRKDGVCMLNG